MADKEKVIKGLAHCTRPSEVGKGGNFCMDCPYTEPIGFNQFKCNSQQMMRDALELLKEDQKLLDLQHGALRGSSDMVELLFNKLDDQPQIVRCKDCKYNDDGECIIKAGWFPVKPEWFCADGERRSE